MYFEYEFHTLAAQSYIKPEKNQNLGTKNAKLLCNLKKVSTFATAFRER